MTKLKTTSLLQKGLFSLPLFLLLGVKNAWGGVAFDHVDLTGHWVGFFALFVFFSAYLLVVLEEVIELRKSKPMMLAAALIWVAIAIVYGEMGKPELAERAIRHDVLEYGELLLFLMVSIAYVNAMDERGVFNSLRAWLIQTGLSYRQLFWLTGFLAFFISSISNNMTTAMLMCAVVMAVGKDDPKFVAVSCVNTVVAANAGGAFCPFGDITTLMVWQKGILDFASFFVLFLPSLANFLVPACFMHFAIPAKSPKRLTTRMATKRGAKRIVLLFLLTILTAVIFENVLHLPAAVGMMAGFTYLQFFSYFMQVTDKGHHAGIPVKISGESDSHRFDVFSQLASMEWDTLLFFYGIVLCVGGINFLGYLTLASDLMYGQLGPTTSNIIVGVVSALIDNIPVMYAILSMNPDMSHGQWLLVTLTAGVGGSLLSVGSAAGVALMGQAKGIYTFMVHLRWFPVILLGYAASILLHFWVNSALF